MTDGLPEKKETQNRTLFVGLVVPVFPSPALQQHKLLEANPAFEEPEVSPELTFSHVMKISLAGDNRLSKFHLFFCVLDGIVEHGGAHTILTLLTHQNFVIHATLAAFPKLLIVGEFRIRNRFIAQVGVDFHNSQAGGQTEDFGIWIFLSGEIKDFSLDLGSDAALTEEGGNNKSRVSHVLGMFPGFDVAKAYPRTVLGDGNDGFPFLDLHLNVLG